MFLTKSTKLSKEQYNALVYLHRISGKLLQQGDPSDETPYEITLGEILQVAGEELSSGELIRLITQK